MNDRFIIEAKQAVALTSSIYLTEDSVYVVWFSKTLGNWKALVSTDVAHGMYWEVTHNGNTTETYVDEYHKFSNHAVIDGKVR